MKLPVTIKEGGNQLTGFVLCDADDKPIAPFFRIEDAEQAKQDINYGPQRCESLKIQRGVSDSLADKVEELKRELSQLNGEKCYNGAPSIYKGIDMKHNQRGGPDKPTEPPVKPK